MTKELTDFFIVNIMYSYRMFIMKLWVNGCGETYFVHTKHKDKWSLIHKNICLFLHYREGEWQLQVL
jgi:hypothetical protein